MSREKSCPASNNNSRCERLAGLQHSLSLGIWFDIGNEDCIVRNCLIAFNEDAGIFYEISYGLHAHDNVIVGNGLADTSGAWGANAGISISSSPGCLIERNLRLATKKDSASASRIDRRHVLMTEKASRYGTMTILFAIM